MPYVKPSKGLASKALRQRSNSKTQRITRSFRLGGTQRVSSPSSWSVQGQLYGQARSLRSLFNQVSDNGDGIISLGTCSNAGFSLQWNNFSLHSLQTALVSIHAHQIQQKHLLNNTKLKRTDTFNPGNLVIAIQPRRILFHTYHISSPMFPEISPKTVHQTWMKDEKSWKYPISHKWEISITLVS